MYTAFFGLREQPFSATPDPRFFYSNEVYQEAYATLLYGILERKGFIVLTGEVGTGKTTLFRRVMNALEARVRLVFFYNTTLTFEELVHYTCTELNLPIKGRGRLHKLQLLNEFLIAEATRGGTVVLLVDEAQNLSAEILENLRLISNLETATQKLLQIVLAGQPELETKLAQPGLRQIAQRIAIRYRLRRLPDEEVGPYIRHRLLVAGRDPQDLFTGDAIHRVAAYSNGIPRLVNIICDGALLLAYGAEAKKVTGPIVDEVAEDLRLQPAPTNAGAAAPAPAGTRQGPDRPTEGARPGARPPVRPVAAMAAGVVAAALLAATAVVFVATVPGSGRFAPVLETVGGLLRSAGDRSALRSVQMGGAGDGRGGAPEPPPAREPLEDAPAAPLALSGPPPSGEPDPPSAPPAAEAPVVMERSMVVPRGSTVSGIVFDFYGDYSLLALDVIKEVNPHIADLDHVQAGERLLVPPLTLEALLRPEPDGSHRLIVASLTRPPDAWRLSDAIRLQGYDVAVVPRWISSGQVMYRVEIKGLRTLAAATRAWNAARVNRWSNVPSTAGSEGG